MNWIHFIGKSYYDPESFIREAKALGVSRRLSRQNLSGFTWGDRIFLAFGDFKTPRRKTEIKKSVVIGYFDLDKIGGIPIEVLEDLPPDKIEIQWSGNQEVSRGCGSYTIVAVSKVSVSVRELAEFLSDGGYPVKPLLRGEFVEIPPVEVDLTFRFGFTRITPERLPLVRGLIPYLKVETGLNSGLAEAVKNYRLRYYETTVWETQRGL